MFFLPCFCISAVFCVNHVIRILCDFFKIMLLIFDFFHYGFEGVWIFTVVAKGLSLDRGFS